MPIFDDSCVYKRPEKDNCLLVKGFLIDLMYM